MGKTAAALADYEKAAAIYSRLLQSHPDADAARFGLARTQVKRGPVLDTLGRRDQAEAAYHAALELLDPLLRAAPDRADYQRLQAEALHNLGILTERSNPRKAVEYYERSGGIRQRLVDRPAKASAEERARAGYLRDLARSYGYLGDVQVTLRAWAAAQDSYEKSRKIRQELVDQAPDDIEAKFQLARGVANFGYLARARNQRSEAIAVYEDVQKRQEQLMRMNRTIAAYKEDLAATCNTLSDLQIDEGQYAAAEKNRQRAAQLYDELLETDGGHIGARSGRAASLALLGKLQARTGKSAEARQTLAEARRQLDDLPAERRTRDDLYRLAYVSALQAELATPEEGPARRDAAQHALAALRQVVAKGYQTVEYLEQDPCFDYLRKHEPYAQELHGIVKELKAKVAQLEETPGR